MTVNRRLYKIASICPDHPYRYRSVQYVLRPVPLREVPAERGHSIPSASPSTTYAIRIHTPSPPPPHRPDPNLKHALPARICVSCAPLRLVSNPPTSPTSHSRKAHMSRAPSISISQRDEGSEELYTYRIATAASAGFPSEIFSYPRMTHPWCLLEFQLSHLTG
ncbi:hypothetical protein B0H16DRAFT_1747108 [Mycena metata]|uniref:Uncharacterized protein n=1 Tax=Mycena metata TaxID=1033252 RepID=A0AAD7M8D8_9AGAR|nr:hypothetical protein B0H16DRAFT_1747108 [Mycena metata]